MADLAVLLSGENATLPFAELRALLAVHDPTAKVEQHGLVAVVQPHDARAAQTAIRRMALGHLWGTLWGHEPDGPDGLARLAAVVKVKATAKGTWAAAADRRAGGKGLSRSEVERALGGALTDAGHPIDLKAPQNTVFAWLLDGRVWVGMLGGRLDRSVHETRTTDDRAHFSPISMHPRRAASLVHLARVKPGGKLLDPFCGTGAIVLEAALDGYAAIGSDLDRFMVQGTMTTLTDAGPEPLEGLAFKADVGDVPALLGEVDGIVCDFPYGRASTAHDEELAALYRRAFEAFAKLLPTGGHVVVGLAEQGLLGAPAGFDLVERHEERMHKSLTRHFLVFRRHQ